jgi:hypothetical protein
MKPTDTKNLNQIYDSLLLLELLDQVGCKNQISDLEANIIQVQESQQKYLEFPRNKGNPQTGPREKLRTDINIECEFIGKGHSKLDSGNFSEFLGKNDRNRDTPLIFDGGRKSLFGDLKFFEAGGQAAFTNGVDPNTNALLADAVISGAQVSKGRQRTLTDIINDRDCGEPTESDVSFPLGNHILDRETENQGAEDAGWQEEEKKVQRWS